MFDWMLMLVLVAVCLPGIFVAAPSLVETQMKTILSKLPPGQEIPPQRTLVILTIVQTLVLVTILAAVGTLLAPRVGLGAPFFKALIAGEGVLDTLVMQLPLAVALGASGAIPFLAAYYLVFRPRLDEESVRVVEGFRRHLGLWSRLLYGGIVEEVISRWGLMTLLVWLGSLLAGQVTGVVVWVAIVLSGLLFAVGHLPAYLGAGARKTPIFIAGTLALNLWASLLFGWLFWQVGLLAAMVGHMLFHLVWLPLDLRHFRHMEPIPVS
jgi:hypothetical protein